MFTYSQPVSSGAGERRGGCPGLLVPISSYGLCDRKATLYRSCVKVEVDVLDSQSPIVRTVSVGVKQHWTNERNIQNHLQQERSKYVLREQKKERKKEKVKRNRYKSDQQTFVLFFNPRSRAKR